jgi:hypothetical protein
LRLQASQKTPQNAENQGICKHFSTKNTIRAHGTGAKPKNGKMKKVENIFTFFNNR